MKERNQEELSLWDAVTELMRTGNADLAIPVLRKAIKGPFSAIQDPLECLDRVSIKVPSEEQLQSLKAFDYAIQQALAHHNFDEAGDRYSRYIDALQDIFEDGESGDMKKKLLGQLLKNSCESQNYVHEQQAPYTTADTKTYTTSEVAEILNVSDQTVRRVCDKGKFPEAYKTDGGHWRVPRKYFKVTPEEAKTRKMGLAIIDQKTKEIAGDDIDEFNV